MKRTRRYREPWSMGTVSVASTYENERIHDFLKGWGTIAKDGKSVLWDHWRPPTKRQLAKLARYWKKNPPFSKFIFPMINRVMPNISAADIVSAQPMSNDRPFNV